MSDDARTIRIEDALALRRLADVYCSAVDDADAERMRSLFVPDGHLVVYAEGAVPGEAEPLRRWDVTGLGTLIATLQQSYVRWVHFLGNHWADVEGDRATGETYLLAHHLRDTPSGRKEEVAVIRYLDRYARTDAGWRFAERNVRRQWTTVRPVASSQHEIDAVLRGRAAS
jgi:hypothetical protein